MPQTSTMTVRIPAEVNDRLEALARATDRSKAYLASRAIQDYLDTQEWQVAAIQAAVSEADAPGAEFVEHAEVVSRARKLAGTKRRK